MVNNTAHVDGGGIYLEYSTITSEVIGKVFTWCNHFSSRHIEEGIEQYFTLTIRAGLIAGSSIYFTGRRFCCHYSSYWDLHAPSLHLPLTRSYFCCNLIAIQHSIYFLFYFLHERVLLIVDYSIHHSCVVGMLCVCMKVVVILCLYIQPKIQLQEISPYPHQQSRGKKWASRWQKMQYMKFLFQW